jgi:fucose 4-O-acetylase-like acetyltransferase
MAITLNGFDEYQVLAKYMWANSILIVTGISLVKISLGFFLLRFAQKVVWKRFIIGMIGMNYYAILSVHGFCYANPRASSVSRSFYAGMRRHSDISVHTCQCRLELYTKTYGEMLLE